MHSNSSTNSLQAEAVAELLDDKSETLAFTGSNLQEKAKIGEDRKKEENLGADIF